MPFVTTRDGTRLHYDDWGDDRGDGTPIVFLGLAMTSARMWEFQSAWFADRGLRCVTYDRRGCGRSDAPWTGYDYDTLADDLAALLDHLDLRDVTLVGYAVGGGEAVRYLTRHGDDRIARLALVASTTPFMALAADNPGGVDPAVLDGLAEVVRADRPRWVAEVVRACLLVDGAEVLSPEMHAWLTGVALDISPRAVLEINRTLLTTDQRAELPAIAVPTLVVHGDQDAAAPHALCARRTAELLPGGVLVTYEGAAHGLFATHHDQLNRDLMEFVKQG